MCIGLTQVTPRFAKNVSPPVSTGGIWAHLGRLWLLLQYDGEEVYTFLVYVTNGTPTPGPAPDERIVRFVRVAFVDVQGTLTLNPNDVP